MFERILVMMDFSPSALAALQQATTAFPNAKITLVHATSGATFAAAAAVTPSGRGPDTTVALASRERAWAHEAAARLRELGGGELVEGDPVQIALDRARSGAYDLVVLGASGARGALGSVARRVVRESPVPVLTCHAFAASGETEG